MSGERLIIFVKAPRRGVVKTRLAASIGPDQAVAAYEVMLGKLTSSLKDILGVELRHSPDDAGDEVRRWTHRGWTPAPQGDGDLGARLYRAFDESFARGDSRVLVIGSDCPYVTAAD